MVRDDIVRYLENYVAHFRPPLAEGVTSPDSASPSGVFELTSTAGDFTSTRW